MVKLKPELSGKDVDLSGYATKTEVAQVEAKIPSVEGLASVDYVSNVISNLEIPEVPENISAFTNDAGYLTEHQSLDGYAKVEDIPDVANFATKDELPSIDGLATEQFVQDEIAKIDIPEVDTSNLVSTAVFNEALAAKADEIPFKTDKFVTSPVGNFVVGDSVKGLTVSQILAKLLGLSDSAVNPDEPTIPDNPEGLINTLIAKEASMYAVTTDKEFVKLPFDYKLMTEAEAAEIATAPCFYQIKNADGNIIESGYQEMQANNGEIYYVIALPKEIDYESMVTLKVWDENMSVWTSTDKFEMTTDPEVVAELCGEVGIDISEVDQDAYTIYVWEDLPSGSLLRYVINE